MRKGMSLALIGLCLALFGQAGAQEIDAQEPVDQPERLFLRVSVYPTANLSRYDYNNDVDLYEIRAYVELRDKNPTGDIIADALVKVHSQPLEFRSDRYEKRIRIEKDALVDEFRISIATSDGRTYKAGFPIPCWLILTEPRPQVIDSNLDLAIRWKFTRFHAPVDVHAYNFKTGEQLSETRNLEKSEVELPGGLIPEGAIIRIWVMQSWLYKRFLRDQALASGSEILIIPWSQVFIRTR